MTIKILPPQLANQIAAGEVVERPASVVKELVENALDAGATKIEIEIERGGHKRILIRDNGKGISKEQLALALSRHATSKIANIDDLEAIISLGFRGEALASISSVSRLTMTSKPADQNEAWSAIAEGLAMDVDIKPAAHPNGTSVDVVDLFFNTPARRKFLRAEKTEFTHIETLIKRIALSRPDVSFILKHNQKVVKKFRSHSSDLGVVEQKSKRIGEVINNSFVNSASVFTSQYDQVNIAVWIKAPELCVSVNPAQYSFVNGRMMRDKLIQHAIRQAYGQLLHTEQLPEYVIFIELPANEVDVNVHPAKHEVRFHHARLLHDLIVKTIKDALDSFHDETESSNQELQLDEHLVPPNVVQGNSTLVEKIESNEQPTWLARPHHEMQTNQSSQDHKGYQEAVAQTEIEKSELTSLSNKPVYKQGTSGFNSQIERQQSVSENQLNQAVNDVFPERSYLSNSIAQPKSPIQHEKLDQGESIGQGEARANRLSVLFIQQLRYVYCQIDQDVWLVDMNCYTPKNILHSELTDNQRGSNRQRLSKTPLLVPIRLKLTVEEKQWCEEFLSILLEHGFDLILHQHYLIVKQVPAILRSNENNRTLPALFNQLMMQALTPEILIDKVLQQRSRLMSNQQIIDVLFQNAKQAGFIDELKASALKLDAEALLN
jgi:DNA mismatch repair protein MutL